MVTERASHGRVGTVLVRDAHRLGDGQWKTVCVKVVMLVASDQVQR
jgi:hypothetical protein